MFPNGLCEARGTEVPRPYSVSGIRDQEHERGRLGDGSLGGRHHGATTRALTSRRATPEGRARRRQPVRNTTSRGTGSSMQALVKGAGTVPARLRGRHRRESAAQRRGSSRQPRVHHNSCASVATTVLPCTPSRVARRVCVEDGHRKSTERESERNLTKTGRSALPRVDFGQHTATRGVWPETSQVRSPNVPRVGAAKYLRNLAKTGQKQPFFLAEHRFLVSPNQPCRAARNVPGWVPERSTGGRGGIPAKTAQNGRFSLVSATRAQPPYYTRGPYPLPRSSGDFWAAERTKSEGGSRGM